MKRVNLIIHGDVQGVLFRSNIKDTANKNNVGGWVRNIKEGTVEVVLEGNDFDVDKVIEFCKKGPSSAKVKKVDIKEGVYKKEFSNFSVKY